MIRLTSAAQARTLRDRIPALAVLRMQQFEGEDGQYDPAIHGHIVVLEAEDQIDRDLPEVGRFGLLDVLDSEWPGYEYVEVFVENGRRVFEMVIQIDADKAVAVIIPDEDWVDPRLRLILEVEARDPLAGSSPGAQSG